MHRPVVSRDEKRIGRLIIFDDVTSGRTGARLVQADKLSSWVCSLRRGARSEHAAGGDLDLPQIWPSGGRRRAEVGPAGQDRLQTSRERDRQFPAEFLENAPQIRGRGPGKVIGETLTLSSTDREGGGPVRLELQDGFRRSGKRGQLQQVFLNLFLTPETHGARRHLEIKAWR